MLAVLCWMRGAFGRHLNPIVFFKVGLMMSDRFG